MSAPSALKFRFDGLFVDDAPVARVSAFAPAVVCPSVTMVTVAMPMTIVMHVVVAIVMFTPIRAMVNYRAIDDRGMKDHHWGYADAYVHVDPAGAGGADIGERQGEQARGAKRKNRRFHRCFLRFCPASGDFRNSNG